MPTYDYECNSCGTVFEAFQSMSAAPLDTCVKCGKKTVRRLIGAGAGIIFKGSGFYCTDYAKRSTFGGNAEPVKKEACPAAETKPAACSGCPKAPKKTEA